MSYAINIKVQDGGTPYLRAVARAADPKTLKPIVGRSATNTIREHLFGMNQSRPNQLGGPRTQFYAQAARSTQFTDVDGGVVISINQVGIAQRYYGGVIRPKNAKYLTIPASPLAHGKRAREFAGLVVLYSIFTKQPYALAIGAVAYQDGKRVKNLSKRAGEIVFWLKKSVNQEPDPTVLPYDELIYARVERDVNQVIDRAIERAGGAT